MGQFKKPIIYGLIIMVAVIFNIYVASDFFRNNSAHQLLPVTFNKAFADDGSSNSNFNANGSDFDSDGYTDCGSGYNSNDNGSGILCDCNDSDSSVNPGASESCNNVDDDCDGSIDEGLSSSQSYSCPAGSCEASITRSCSSGSWDNDCNVSNDCDGDGYDVCASSNVNSNSNSNSNSNGSSGSCDCDDTDIDIYPGASETCNGLDDDCDGTIDDGFSSVTDTCNGIDDNCDGYIDENDNCESCTFKCPKRLNSKGKNTSRTGIKYNISE